MFELEKGPKLEITRKMFELKTARKMFELKTALKMFEPERFELKTAQ